MLFLGLLVAAAGGFIVGSLDHVVAGRSGDGDPPVSLRHPLVKAVIGLLFVAVVLAHRDDGAQIVLGLALVAFLVPLALADLDTRLAPDRIVAAAAVTAIVLGTLVDGSGEGERVLAAVAAGGLLLLVALAHPPAIGLGDVKLAAVLGLFLGREVAAAVLIALVCGLVARAMVRRSGRSQGRATGPPFGVSLALAGIAALLLGESLVDAYLGAF